MAELDGTLTSAHRKLGSSLVSPPSSPAQEKPHRPIINLLSRAAFLLVFTFLLPLFPSQAPEFVNQTLLTRTWELLHLLLVGVAVSYGLFSHRNVNAEPAAPEKEADTPQSYLSQLLQVSPVFDDEEPGTPCGLDEGKVRMWSSRYQRGLPTVVVEVPESLHDSDSADRRLLLPLRSLRTSVPPVADSPGKKDDRERVEEAGSPDPPVQKEELSGADSVILPSPIPWRSRSGRMKSKEETSGATAPPSHSLPMESTFGSVSFPSPNSAASSPSRLLPSSPFSCGPSARTRSWRMEAKEEASDAAAPPPRYLLSESTLGSVSFRSPPSRPSSTSASPRRLSPSPPLSPEPRAKAREDSLKNKIFFNQPPPPPPLLPTSFVRKPPNILLEEKKSRLSSRDELKNPNGRNRESDEDWECSSDRGSPCYSRLHTKPRSHTDGCYYSVGKSVRTVRPREARQDAGADVTTLVTAPGEKKKKKKKKKKKNWVEDDVVDDAHDDDAPVTASSDKKKNNNWVEDEVAVDRDSTDAGEASNVGEVRSGDAADDAEEENEVDKKADAFIARFREQIRLQRIESIKMTAVLSKT